MTSVSPWVPCVPCDFCLTCVPGVPLSPLCCLCPLCSLCPLLSVVSLMSPVFLFFRVPCVSCVLCVSFVACVFLCSLFFPSRVPLFLLKNMKYSVALPLFLIWRENLGVPLLHVTTCGFFCTLRMSRDVIFYENKKQNTKFCFNCLEFFYLINELTVHRFTYLNH